MKKSQVSVVSSPTVAMHGVEYGKVRGTDPVMSRLKEILGAPTSRCRNSTLVVRYRREDREARVEVFAEVHDRGYVAAAVAVVGRTPDRDDGFVFEVPLREDRRLAGDERYRSGMGSLPCNPHSPADERGRSIQTH